MCIDSIRREALPEEVSIHIAEMTAMKEIKEREHMMAVFQNQGKQLILCKVLPHIGIKGNNAAKQAIDIPGIATTKLPFTDFYLTTRRTKNSEWQRE